MHPKATEEEATRRKNLARIALVAAAALVLVPFMGTPAQSQGATITVNSTADVEADDGECTLREAIIAANTNTASGTEPGECDAGEEAPEVDTIEFDIPGADPGCNTHCTIQPLSALPTLEEPVVIDGYTQPGASENTLAVGSDAVLMIELDGSELDSGDGLRIVFDGRGSTIRGLVINQFPNHGILITSAPDNFIQGNFIGTNVDATEAFGNEGSGVHFSGNSWFNTIGGTELEERNVISGNNDHGVLALNAAVQSSEIQGNLIGTNAAGDGPLPNGMNGVRVHPSDRSTIVGGTALGAGNVISGNGSDGVHSSGLLTWDGRIEGNFIGTDATGAGELGNGGHGVSLSRPEIMVGGIAQGAGNVISGNASAGVHISGATRGKNEVLGNFIGTNADGDAALPNSQSGVTILNAPDNTIGGTDPGAGNVISGNGEEGVFIFGIDAEQNVVAGNFIGTNAADATNLGNDEHGVRIQNAPNNTIGGDTVAHRNVISGNDNDGVHITGTPATGNLVEGNYIGTNTAGTGALGNADEGVEIDEASDNTVRDNVISGNTSSGVRIDGDENDVLSATNNVVEENFIGTNFDGTAAIGNGDEGVRVTRASGNTIGPGNVISGNTLSGVRLDRSTATENVVAGNFIGTNADGDEALANDGSGVVIENGASENTIGGTDPEDRNVISGNVDNGVSILGGATLNKVQGNHIGTNAAGTAALGNGSRGVSIFLAPGNTVGGTTAGAGNVISGNGSTGVLISGSGATGSLVEGNHIGTNAAGTEAIGNTDMGVEIDQASDNIVRDNVISGNNSSGVRIDGDFTDGLSATDNVVEENFIGTNVDGTTAIGNGDEGVRVNRASGNTIGPGNVISGNDALGAVGVRLDGSTATENVVAGNFIGTNAAGTDALGNGGNGVLIEDGASGNVIGGATAGERNVISGNSPDGVQIDGATSTENTIQGNFIGTNASGDAALPNSGDGVRLFAPDNVIGGTAAGAGNLISGNGLAGVRIFGANGTGNEVQGNLIGTDEAGTADVGNGFTGVIITNAEGNKVGGTAAGAGNVVAFNGSDGVRVTGASSVENPILGNSIFDNTGLGIDLGGDGVTPNDPLDADTGPNNLQNFPELTAAEAGSTTVEGTLHSSPNDSFRVEFFASPDCDTSGHGEGRDFLGFAVVETDGDGNAPISESLAPTATVGHVVTATATRLDNGTPTDTSEFSACVEVEAAPAPPPPPPPPPPPDDEAARNIALAPQTATNDTGTEHEITATVTDAAGGTVAGAAVAWNLTGVGSVVSQETTTNAQGQARITITSAQPGTSTVTGSLDPQTTDCDRAADDPPGAPEGNCTAQATKTWQEDPDPRVPFRCLGHTGMRVPGEVHRESNPNDPTGVGEIIVGTNGDDVLVGTPGDDVMCGAGGNDIMRGLAGNDRIAGGPGNDEMFGGPGNDRMWGGRGADTMRGGRGRDVMRGGPGRDVIRGGPGNDRLFGGPGNDRLFGGRGSDRIFGGPGNDILRGGPRPGQNFLHGGRGFDRCFGRPNTIFHRSCNVQITS